MNVYELVSGPIRYFVAAEDEGDAYAQGTDPEQFPDMHYRPFEIRKVEVNGYIVTVTPNALELISEGETTSKRGGRRTSK